MILSYKYRIEPSAAQGAALGEMLRDFCGLYNAALEERINAFRAVANGRHEVVWGTYKDRRGKEREGYIRRHLSKIKADASSNTRAFDQIKALTPIRRELPHLARWSCSAEQQVIRRVEKTFKAFFKRGEGFPRFRASARYHAAEFRVGDGLTLRKSGKLGFVGVPGEVKVRWHRKLPSEPSSAILTRQNGKWFVIFHVEVEATERTNDLTIGLDMGLTSLVALSNSERVGRPNFTKRAAKGLRRRQRALARCKRGSKTRGKRRLALARYQAKIANGRRDNLHKLSRNLVNRFGRIAVEDLNIKGLASGMLAKPVNDASWAQLVSMIAYKAESAGREFIQVDPRGTSQTCPECGTIAKKTLAERIHRCDCGCVLDRDVAAAMVVHFRAFGIWPGSGLETPSQRVAA